MAYSRCECKGGDVPHKGAAVHKARSGSIHTRWDRCTRRATTALRRTVLTNGRPNTSPGFSRYCEPCARAIEAYQGSLVERVTDENL